VLIDAGINYKHLKRRLGRLGLGIEEIDGIAITYTHGDHFCSGAVKACLEDQVPLHVHRDRQTLGDVKHEFYNHGAYIKPLIKKGFVNTFRLDEKFEIGGIGFKPFRLPHDEGVSCVGFRIYDGRRRVISFASDFGFSDDDTRNDLVSTMANSDMLVIESDYDHGKLVDSDADQWDKERVMKTHLSNYQAAQLALEIIRHERLNGGQRLSRIVLAHISKRHNSISIAKRTVEDALKTANAGISVETTYRFEAGKLGREIRVGYSD
jgi:phosphoribosyl 1,2-cyclic phosphodiesterase